VRNWRRRWFVLRNNELSYYKTAEVGLPPPSSMRTAHVEHTQIGSEAAGVIKLDSLCNVHPASRKIGRPNAFELITEERVYNLFADDKDLMDKWITDIKRAANHESVAQVLKRRGQESH
jgi:hypothetical protein